MAENPIKVRLRFVKSEKTGYVVGFVSQNPATGIWHGVPEDKPYRGPREYADGGYVYRCDTEGSFDWFQGKESISYQGKQIYECCFHGGLIR